MVSLIDPAAVRRHLTALRSRLAAGRERYAPWLTRRRAVIVTVSLLGLGAVALVADAAIRGHLGDPADRAPSAFVTRSEQWGGGNAQPVAFATVGGAPFERREPVAIDEMPKHLIDAVLAVEDQRFLDHDGLDLRRIAGAMLANVRALGIEQGGSTVTQQLAKNLFLSQRRTPLRKLREAAFAAVLEARYDKQKILEAYLNEVYLGQDGGRAIHGMGAASRYYFGKDVRKIVLSEAATLAGMIRSPNRLAPSRHPAAARDRRNLVLRLMAEQGRVKLAQAEQSSKVRVPTKVHPLATVDGRWFRDAIDRRQIADVAPRGAVIRTTLDARLQQAAERAVEAAPAGGQVALVAIDPRSGDVLAMVGGRNYGQSQFNRAVDAKRQPGSAFKPIVALAALQGDGSHPPKFTLASRLDDSPFEVTARNQPTWRPANYDGSFRGEVTFREALEKSLNIPFARIGMQVGPEEMVSLAHRMGITSKLQPVPALALGASEVSLLELVRAYGVLANGGVLVSTRMVVDGTSGSSETVVDQASAFLVTTALQGVVSRGTGRAMASRGAFAGKTGTSNDWRDAWFIAYTPELVVGVWTGHDDGRSIGRSGGAAALPVVSRFLAEGKVRAVPFAVPDGIERAYSVAGSYYEPCGEMEYFLAGTAPSSRGCWDRDFYDPDIDFGEYFDRFNTDRFEREIRTRATNWLRRMIGGR